MPPPLLALPALWWWRRVAVFIVALAMQESLRCIAVVVVRLYLFLLAGGTINNQPNHCTRRRMILCHGWHLLFWSYQKRRQEKNWKVYCLFCILSVFSSSHRIQHCSWRLFFIMWPTYFLGIVRNHVSLGSLNHNLHTRSYREILHMYLWYSKKKGVNVGNPRHKNTVSGLVLCRHDREMLAKSADIWLSGQHVADMLPTFPAKTFGM